MGAHLVTAAMVCACSENARVHLHTENSMVQLHQHEIDLRSFTGGIGMGTTQLGSL